MGMFDKDKEIGRQLIPTFKFGDEFILWDAQVDADPVTTKIGPARKTRLLVSRLDKPADKFELSTLGSAIADKAEEAEESDFPAVVQVLQVEGQANSQATVLQFVKPYEDARAKFRTPQSQAPAPATPTAQPPSATGGGGVTEANG